MFDSLNIDEQYGYLLAKSEPAYRLPQNSAFENVLGVLCKEGRIQKRGAYYYFKKEEPKQEVTTLSTEFEKAFQKYIDNAKKLNKGVVQYTSFEKRFHSVIRLRTYNGSDIVKFLLLCTAIHNENYGLNLSIYPAISEIKIAEKLMKLADTDVVLNAIFKFSKENESIFKLYSNFNKYAEFEKRGGW